MTMGNQPQVVAVFNENTGDCVLKIPGHYIEQSCDIVGGLFAIGRGGHDMHKTFLTMVSYLEAKEAEARFIAGRKAGVF